MTWVRELIQATIKAGNIDGPFYVVNIDDLLRKYNEWQTKMPNITPFYAVKCNPSPLVLETLAAFGIGFDCASKAEIEAVLKIGVHPSRIIYANPCKSIPYLTYAKEKHVHKMTFDNEDELQKIKKIFPKAELVLRIKVDDSEAKYKLGAKFGTKVEHAPYLLKMAKQLGLHVIGVSFHVGSGCLSEKAHEGAISDAKKVFECAQKLGFKMTLLDIGGGFPGRSDPKEKAVFDKIAVAIQNTLRKYFPSSMGINIIAEPGRYFVASALTLTANIIAKRVEEPEIEGQDPTVMYYINDGMYGSFSNTTFEEGDSELIPIEEIDENSLKKRRVLPSTIWGPTCDSLDCIQSRIFLPEMEVGEWMTFTDMGAYTSSCGTNFNGFSLPVVKCHASPEVIEWFKNTPSWDRLSQAFGITEDDLKKKCNKGLVYKIWEYLGRIHVHAH